MCLKHSHCWQKHSVIVKCCFAKRQLLSADHTPSIFTHVTFERWRNQTKLPDSAVIISNQQGSFESYWLYNARLFTGCCCTYMYRLAHLWPWIKEKQWGTILISFRECRVFNCYSRISYESTGVINIHSLISRLSEACWNVSGKWYKGVGSFRFRMGANVSLETIVVASNIGLSKKNREKSHF